MQQPPSKAKTLVSSLYKFLDQNEVMGGMPEDDFVKNMQNPKFADGMYKLISEKELLADVKSFDQFYRPFKDLYSESQKKSEVGTEGSTTTLPEERVEATGPEVRDGFVMDEQGAPMRSVPRSVEAAQVQEAAAPEAGAMPEQRPVPETPTPLMKPRTAETPAPIAPGQEAAFAKAEKERQAFGFPTQQQAPDAFGQKEADFPIKSANTAIRELEQARQDRQQGQRAKPTGEGEMSEIEAAFRGKGAKGPTYGSFFEDTRVGKALSQGGSVMGATFRSIGAGAANIPELLANVQEDITLEFANNDLQRKLKQGKITEQEYNDAMKASREVFRAIQGASAKATGAPNIRATEWLMDNYLNADEAEDAARKNLQEVQARVDNADKGFEGLAKEGRYADALQYATTQAIGSLPYMITAMLPGGAYVVGGVAAQDKYRQIQDMGGDMSATDALNAVGTGLVEGLSEAVSGKLAKQAFKLVQKLGKEAAEKTLKQQLKQVGRRVLGSALEEGASEGLAQFAENLIDKVTIDPNKDLTEGVIDALAIGALTGGALTGAGGAIGLAGRVRGTEAATAPTPETGTPAPETPAAPVTEAGAPAPEAAAPAPETPTTEAAAPTPGETAAAPTEPAAPAPTDLFPEPQEAQRMAGYAETILAGVNTEITPEEAQQQIDTYLESLMEVNEDTGEMVPPRSGYDKETYDEVMINRDKLSQLISQQSKQKADAAKEIEKMQPQGGEQQYPGTEGLGPQAPTETDTGDRPIGGGMQPQEGGQQEGQVGTGALPEGWQIDAGEEERQTRETSLLARGVAEARRQAGRYVRDGVEYVRRAPDTKNPKGSEGTVRFATGIKKKFRYKAIEADELEPSHLGNARNPMHFIPEAQPKRREKGTDSIAAQIEIANRTDTDLLGANNNAYQGAPVVNRRNEVIQGNNRSAGIRLGYQSGSFGNYREWLVSNAASFGLDPEAVGGMKNPVLVRELEIGDEEGIYLGQFKAADLETGGEAAIDPVTTAAKMTDKEKAEVARILFDDTNLTPAQAVRKKWRRILELIGRHLNPMQKNGLVNQDGEITARGVDGILSIFQQFLFADGAIELQAAFERLPYKTVQGITKAVKFIFSVPPEQSLLDEIQTSILAYSEYLASGISNIDDWAVQRDMFDAQSSSPSERYSPLIFEMIRKYETLKETEITNLFKQYATLMRGKAQQELIMEGPAEEKLTKTQAIERVFNVKNYGQGEQAAISGTTAQGAEGMGAQQPAGAERPTGQDVATTEPEALAEPQTIEPLTPGAQLIEADIDGNLLYDGSGRMDKQGRPIPAGEPGTPKNPFRSKVLSAGVKMLDTDKVSEADFMAFMEKEIKKRASDRLLREPGKTLEQVTKEMRENAKARYKQIKALAPLLKRLGLKIYPGTSDETGVKLRRGSFVQGMSSGKAFIYINAIHAPESTVKHELAHAVVESLYKINKAGTKSSEELVSSFFPRIVDAVKSTGDTNLISALQKVMDDFSENKRFYNSSKVSEEYLVEFIARLDEGLRGKLLDNTTLGKIERAVNALLDSILGKGVLNVRFSNTQDLLDFLGAVSRGVSNADVASMDEALSMYAMGRIEAPVRAMYWKKKEIKGSRELIKGITDRLEQGNYAEMKSAEGIVNEILAGVFGNGRYIVKFTGTQDAKGFFENIAEEIRINGQRVPSSHVVRAELLLAVNDYLQTIAKASPQLEDDMSADVKADMQAYYEKFPPVAGRPLEPTDAEKRMVENMDAQYKADQRSYDLYAEKVSVPDVVNQDNMKGLPMQQKVSMLQERTGNVPSVAAIQTAASPDPHGMYALLETVQAKMNALSRGAVDKKDVAKAAFAHAFGDARAHFQAVMDKVRVMDEAFISTAKEGGQNYYMLDGHGAASLLLNSESGQRFIENASSAAIAAQPTEQTAQKAGMTANNLKGLYDVNRKAFGLDRSKALASAVAMDRMIGQMAKRAGVPKSEIYSKLNFKKSSEEILKQEPGVLFQIDAWHGSPYLFDKFSTEFIDKGEGAQAFGWGLYFTGLEDIADWYASELTKQKFPGGYAGDMRSGLEALMKVDKGLSKRLVSNIKDLNMSVYQSMADKIKGSAIISDRLQSQVNEIEAIFQTAKDNKGDTGEALVPLFSATHGWKSPYRYRSETLEAIKGIVNGTQRISFGKEVDSAIAKNKAKLAEIFSPENEQRIIDNEILYELADAIEGSANRSGIFSKEERDEIASNAARMRQIFESVSPEFKKIQKSDTSKKKYKVTLFKGKKPDQYKLIDWFGPVKQYEWLVNELNNERKRRWFPNGFSEKETGQSLYGKLSEIFGEKGAAQFLMYHGIDGIRYPAESKSRGTEKPRGYNYVVFDEKSVSIKKVIKYQKDAVAARGAAMVGMDGQATIYALTSPNVSTPLHELAHVYEHYLSDAERKTVMSAAGTQAWTTETSEYFARGFERYLAEGIAPDNAMKRIFEKFKQWLTDIYNGITGSEIDVALNDEMRKIYAQMLGVEPTLNKTATERDTDFEQQVADVLQPFGVNAAELFDKFYAAMQANETGGLKAAEKTLASGRSLAASILGLGDVSKKDAAALEKAIETGTPMAVNSTGIDGLDARADAIAGAVGMDKGVAREAMKNMVARHLTEEKDLEFFEDTLMLMDEEFYSQLNGRSDSIPEDIVVMNDMSTNPYGQKPYYKQARAFVWNEIKNGKSDKQIVDALQTMYSNGANGYDAREFFENVTGRKYRSQVDPVDEMMDSAFMFMRSILRLNLKEVGVAATVFRRTVPKSRLRDVAYSIDFQLGNDLAFFRKLQREVEKSMGSLMPEEMAGYQKMQLYISAAAFEIDKFAKSFYGDKKTTTASGTKDSFISRLTRSAVRSVNEFNTFLAAMHKQERMDRLIDIQERFLLQLYDDIKETANKYGASQLFPYTMPDIPAYDPIDMIAEIDNAIANTADPDGQMTLTVKRMRFRAEENNLKRGEQRKDKARQDFTQYLKSKGVANPATVNPDDLRAMPQFADHFAFMQEFKDMQKAYLDILREAGQLDDARYDHLVNGTSSQSGVTWKYYVPLVYDEHVYNDEMGLPNPKSERAVSRFGIKGLTRLMGKRKPQPTPGGGKPVNPLLYEDTSFEKPVEVLFHRMAGAIRFKHRNDAIRSVALTMEASQDPGFKIFSARSVPRLDRWGNPNGVTDLISPEIKKQSQVFYEGGKRKYIYFVDPDSPILAKLKSGTDDLSGIMQLFMSLNNIARGLFTYLRPSFLVANLFRDFQEAFTNVQVEGRTFNLAANAPGTPGFKKFKKQIIKAYAKRYGQSAAYLTKNLFGAQGDPQMSSYYRELQELGGLMSWSFDSMELIRDQMRTVEENINYAERYASGKSPIEATKRLFLNSSIEAVHRVSDKIEAFSRLATYAAMRDMGVEPVRAAEMAKNITLNFEKKGANKVVRAIGPLWLFLNPAVQGIRKSGKQMASPEGRKALLLYAGTSFALRGLLYSLPDMIGWFGEDEEKEKAARSDIETYIYSRYVSETKMMIPNPLDPNNPLLLPKPFGNFRVAAAAGEGLADLITGYKTPMDVAANLSNQLKGAMDPIAGTSSWANQYMEVLPLPILSPVFETMANSDHYGRAIVYDMSGSFDYLKANRKTPQIYRDIAKGLYMHTPNHIDISPSSIEHVYESYISLGPAQFVKNARDAWKDVAAEDAKTSKDKFKRLLIETTFINRVLYNDNISKEDKNDLYNYLSMSSQPPGRWNAQKVAYAERALEIARNKELTNERVLQSSLIDLMSQVVQSGKLYQTVPGREITWEDWYMEQASPMGEKDLIQMSEALESLIEQTGAKQQK